MEMNGTIDSDSKTDNEHIESVRHYKRVTGFINLFILALLDLRFCNKTSPIAAFNVVLISCVAIRLMFYELRILLRVFMNVQFVFCLQCTA